MFSYGKKMMEGGGGHGDPHSVGIGLKNMGIVHTVLYSSFDIIIVKFISKMEIDFKSDAINDFDDLEN